MTTENKIKQIIDEVIEKTKVDFIKSDEFFSILDKKSQEELNKLKFFFSAKGSDGDLNLYICPESDTECHRLINFNKMIENELNESAEQIEFVASKLEKAAEILRGK